MRSFLLCSLLIAVPAFADDRPDCSTRFDLGALTEPEALAIDPFETRGDEMRPPDLEAITEALDSMQPSRVEQTRYTLVAHLTDAKVEVGRLMTGGGAKPQTRVRCEFKGQVGDRARYGVKVVVLPLPPPGDLTATFRECLEAARGPIRKYQRDAEACPARAAKLDRQWELRGLKARQRSDPNVWICFSLPSRLAVVAEVEASFERARGTKLAAKEDQLIAAALGRARTPGAGFSLIKDAPPAGLVHLYVSDTSWTTNANPWAALVGKPNDDARRVTIAAVVSTLDSSEREVAVRVFIASKLDVSELRQAAALAVEEAGARITEAVIACPRPALEDLCNEDD